MWDITSGFSEWKLNACWPSVEWQIYDWYLRPMVSYYYIKKACEPLHVQLTPLDMAVTVVNHRLQPEDRLKVRARVHDFAMKKLFEQTATIDMPANAYREVFAIPSMPELMPLCFVKLDVKDRAGSTVSDNFYWLAPKDPSALGGLDRLPTAQVRSSWAIVHEGRECVARVRVENLTDRLAMFVHTILTKGPGGDEILPVFWDDNYVNLLPGESKQLCARFAAEDLGPAAAALEVGGWNVETDYRCLSLQVSKAKAKVGEPVAVTARIAETCLDGSRVTLLLDDQPVETTWVWARGTRTADASFSVNLSQRGRHRIVVGRQSAVDRGTVGLRVFTRPRAQAILTARRSRWRVPADVFPGFRLLKENLACANPPHDVHFCETRHWVRPLWQRPQWPGPPTSRRSRASKRRSRQGSPRTGSPFPIGRSGWALSALAVCRFGAQFSLQDHPNVQVVAVSDLFPDRCQALAKACKCEKTYPSLEEMVKDDSIEAIFVATDAPSHCRHCIDVLNHGKHVATAVPAVWMAWTMPSGCSRRSRSRA